MKNRIKLILLIAIANLIWSCKETPKNEKDSDKAIIKTKKAEKKNAEEKLLVDLKNIEPVDKADLAAWIPKTLGGLALERTKSISVFKEVQMTGWYKREGDKNIILSITDAAGPNAGMIADKINVFGSEPDSDVGDIQMKSVNVKGRMARQDRSVKKNMTNITFFHNKRFMIKISALDYNIEEAWSLVDALDFKGLDYLIK